MGYNIGFDADGVIYDTELFQLSNQVIDFMKKEYNLDVINPDGYGIKDVFGCSKEIELDFWEKFVIKYSLLYRPRTWTKETIDKLRADGNKVFIITSKACALEKSYRGIGVRLLFELGLKLNGIKIDDIVYCDLDNSAESKLQACQKLNITIMVEDAVENINLLSKHMDVICMNTLNNESLENDNIIRADDIPDVYVNVQKIIASRETKSNSLTSMHILSVKEKEEMSLEEKDAYYDSLIDYYKSFPFDERNMSNRESIINLIANIYSKIFYSKYDPIILGMENIPKEKGFIYVCNHLCDKDMIFLLCALKGLSSCWHPLVKMEILEQKPGILFRTAQSAFVKREVLRSRRSSMKDLFILLSNYFNVLIFPEGTYNKTQNNLKDFQGVSHVYLSQVLRRPIVNMALTSDYSTNPILRIDEPYIVPRTMSLADAKEDSFNRLSSLVEKNKKLSLERRSEWYDNN